ncbi:MAG: hypothetical protein IJB83_02090 [Bacilli bacterium]|nr:hypothetical protein [Bacilli bacterium]
MSTNIFDFFKNIKLSEIASGANRTLSVAKKAIPVYKEVRPFFDGKKKLFNKKNELQDEVESRPIMVKEISETRGSYNDNLTFFQ